MPDRRSSLASLARQAVIISNGLTSAAIAARMPHCLARPCLQCPAKPSCASAALFVRLSLCISSRLPPSPPRAALVVGSLASNPYRRPSPSSIPCFSVSLGAAARSLGLSEAARPLVFLLFPSRLLLVITTNLSRINSPSGINSSTVQAEKEKVIAGVGAGNSPAHPRYDSPLCTPYGERERRYRDGECRVRSVMLRERRVESRRAKTVNVVTSRNEERPRVNNSSGAR